MMAMGISFVIGQQHSNCDRALLWWLMTVVLLILSNSNIEKSLPMMPTFFDLVAFTASLSQSEFSLVAHCKYTDRYLLSIEAWPGIYQGDCYNRLIDRLSIELAVQEQSIASASLSHSISFGPSLGARQC